MRRSRSGSSSTSSREALPCGDIGGSRFLVGEAFFEVGEGVELLLELRRALLLEVGALLLRFERMVLLAQPGCRRGAALTQPPALGIARGGESLEKSLQEACHRLQGGVAAAAAQDGFEE